MRATVAKRIRKYVYGDHPSPFNRKYFRTDRGNVVADMERRRYQLLKKAHNASKGS